MEKKDIENYLEKLRKFDELLTNENGNDEQINIITEIGDVLSQLNTDVRNEVKEPLNNKLQIKVKKLNSIAKLPCLAKFGDAGFDVTATRIISETPEKITYGTDIAIEIPYGYVGLLFPRSSIRKYTLDLSNSVGVCDAGYRGELQATFNKLSEFPIKYNNGDRIFQIIILPIPEVEYIEVDELSTSERNDGGFGHSGK